jgi:hypothetical protein
MASPGEMVRTVAEVLGVAEATVTVHDRNLVIAGLRKKGGRGRSAAKMTPLDTANLLIGVAASSMVRDTVEIVNDYANLFSKGGERSIQKDDGQSFEYNAPPTWNLWGFPIPALQKLREKHTFRDALVALIEASADGTLLEAEAKLRADSFAQDGIADSCRIQVILWGPSPQAAIRISRLNFAENHHYSNMPNDVDAITQWSQEMSVQYGNGDLRQIREFSKKTILAVGDLLRR